MVEPYSVRVERQDGTATIRLRGDIDLCAGPAVRAAVADVVLGEPSTRVVFELTETTFADSMAVGALVLACHAALMVGASIEVASNPMVDRVLDVSGVAAFFGSRSELAAAG
jgi:anti-anti-sigma factor